MVWGDLTWGKVGKGQNGTPPRRTRMEEMVLQVTIGEIGHGKRSEKREMVLREGEMALREVEMVLREGEMVLRENWGDLTWGNDRQRAGWYFMLQSGSFDMGRD